MSSLESAQSTAPAFEADYVVVGAGPAGITAALELARRGQDVLLVESGTKSPDATAQALGDAASFDPSRHAPMNEATRRQVGGASVIWGGRCVPFDPIDFESRSYVPESNWPITYGEVAAFHARACEYFRAGRPVFDVHELDHIEQKSIVPGLVDGDALSSSLERWSLPTNFGREYAAELESRPNLRLLAGFTCVKLEPSADVRRISRLHLARLDGTLATVHARKAIILACGGLETTRLLLASPGPRGTGLGNAGGQLGRFYMGHISGRIAEVAFTTDPKKTVFDYDRDVDGTYVRRRFSIAPDVQRREHINNIVAWLVNPTLADPRHENGVLSFAYLALASPLGKFFAPAAIRKAAIEGAAGATWAHVKNMLVHAPATAWFMLSFGYRRFLAHRRAPGFFQYSAENVYPLHYHGEQVPLERSRVELSDERDALGLPRLKVALEFAEQDVTSVIKAHRIWDAHLQKQGKGRLRYLTDDLESSVWEQASDGFHQAGTTRMSVRPEDGVVDPNLRVHGLDNLYVASSSTFVTSGQANSTFLIVALTLRLVDHLLAGGRELTAG